MTSKRCLICSKEDFSTKIGIQKPNSSRYFPCDENLHCQQADLQITFLLRKLLEIPEDTYCKLNQCFRNTSLWIECCDSCSQLVEKCKGIFEQIELLQKQYEELRSNIKTTMLKSQKTLFFESKCEAIVRSHVITQEIDNFINTSVTEADIERFDDGKSNLVPSTMMSGEPFENPQGLPGFVQPVLFEKINIKMEVEEDITSSFDEDENQDCNFESSDFENAVHSDNPFDFQENSCNTIQSDNLMKEPYRDISSGENRNLNPSESESLPESSFVTQDLDQSHVLSAKSAKRSRKSNNSLKKTYTEEPRAGKSGDSSNCEKDNEYECPICLEIFTLYDDLKNHFFAHSYNGKITFACETCGKVFKSKNYFKQHRMIHSTGEKPHKCNLCGISYTTTQNLNIHMRSHTHSDEKPFECNVCGKAFGRSSTLYVHKRSHIAKKPFKCDICDKSFKLNTLLKSHRKGHLK